MIDTDLLRRVPLFEDFEAEHLDELAAVVTIRKYPKNAFLVREGEPGDAFFIILRGAVAVVKVGANESESILSILREGDYFGEMSVFDSSQRSASVKAINGPVEAGVVEQRDILALMERRPAIGRILVVTLSRRLRAANASISANSSQDIRSRLAALLLNLKTNFGEPVESGTRITLRLTNQQMANMIGTTRETVNRTLNKFWDEHLIDMKTSHIIVVAPEKLEKIQS